MLTESEREWLEERKWCRFLFQCEECPKYDPMRIMHDKVDVPCKHFSLCATYTNSYDLADAAEFEARVAAKLAKIMPKALADPWFIENAKYINADATLEWARLSVEEEMDANAR